MSETIEKEILDNNINKVNHSANMLKSRFYVCPLCGNVIHSMFETEINCHGKQLIALEAEHTDNNHKINIEVVEDEYYVRIDHSMTKEHYISFIAAVSGDNMQMVKLYPEGNAEARFKIRGAKNSSSIVIKMACFQ